MSKYHNSPKGPRRCTDTTGRCPYAQAGMEHFSNLQDAQVAYEETMKQSFGSFQTIKVGKIESGRQAIYGTQDAVVRGFDNAVSQAKSQIRQSISNVKQLRNQLIRDMKTKSFDFQVNTRNEFRKNIGAVKARPEIQYSMVQSKKAISQAKIGYKTFKINAIATKQVSSEVAQSIKSAYSKHREIAAQTLESQSAAGDQGRRTIYTPPLMNSIVSENSMPIGKRFTPEDEATLRGAYELRLSARADRYKKYANADSDARGRLYLHNQILANNFDPALSGAQSFAAKTNPWL